MIVLKTVRLKQPLKEMYICKIDSKILYDNSKVYMRKFSDEFEATGGQRGLDRGRQKKLKKYVKLNNATFPNSIITTISRQSIVTEPTYNDSKINSDLLILEESPDLFNIIDGQHRLSSFENNEIEDFELILTIFVDLDNYQKVFGIVNGNQKPVDRSLNDELESTNDYLTPEKLLIEVIKSLAFGEESPLYNKIKIYGYNNTDNVNLSLASFKREVIGLIYNYNSDYYDIRYCLQDSATFEGAIYDFSNNIKANYGEKRPLWEYYKLGESNVITKILFNYFISISKLFSNDWNRSNPIIYKSIFFRVWILILKKLLIIGKQEKDLSIDFFDKKLSKLAENFNGKISDENFTVSSYGDASKIYKQFINYL